MALTDTESLGDPVADTLLWIMQAKANENAQTQEALLHWYDQQKEEIKLLRDEVYRLKVYENAVLTMKEAMFPIYGEP